MKEYSQQILSSHNLEIVTLRLSPGEDLKQFLGYFLEENRIEAGFVLTCVGSLTQAQLRFADQDKGTLVQGPFEILSLTGTLSTHGSHLHLGVSDSIGQTLGGHVLEGCLVYTTVEIVIGLLPGLQYKREHDEASGYLELKVYKKPRK